MLPNFLGIGAQRSATTWIYENLRKHPDIFMPARKELRFFSLDRNYDKGLEWYEKWFNEHNNQKMIGEYSPSYIHSIKAPKRIKEILPNIRFIVCLRNPIERAYSQYGLYVRNRKHRLDFREAIEKYPDYIEKGYYYSQIQRYLEFFPLQAFLILIFDDLVTDPVSFIKKIYEFLEVDSAFIPFKLEQRRNRGIALYRSTLQSIFIQGVKYARRNRVLRPITDTVKRVNRINQLAGSVIFRHSYKKIDPKVRQQLQRKFYEQNKKLSEFLDRNLIEEWK